MLAAPEAPMEIQFSNGTLWCTIISCIIFGVIIHSMRKGD